MNENLEFNSEVILFYFENWLLLLSNEVMDTPAEVHDEIVFIAKSLEPYFKCYQVVCSS